MLFYTTVMNNLPWMLQCNSLQASTSNWSNWEGRWQGGGGGRGEGRVMHTQKWRGWGERDDCSPPSPPPPPPPTHTHTLKSPGPPSLPQQLRMCVLSSHHPSPGIHLYCLINHQLQPTSHCHVGSTQWNACNACKAVVSFIFCTVSVCTSACVHARAHTHTHTHTHTQSKEAT